MTERRVDGSGLRLVTVCCPTRGRARSLASWASRGVRPPVLNHLRPSEARELAFCLLELAELAERRGEADDERA